MDMHSGGGLKEPAQYIYIEAPEEQAVIMFYNLFGHSPDRISCTCCGEDYSYRNYGDQEHLTLEQVSSYERGCDHQDNVGEKGVSWIKCIPFDEWLLSDECIMLPIEAFGEVPKSGYVWIN